MFVVCSNAYWRTLSIESTRCGMNPITGSRKLWLWTWLPHPKKPSPSVNGGLKTPAFSWQFFSYQKMQQKFSRSPCREEPEAKTEQPAAPVPLPEPSVSGVVTQWQKTKLMDERRFFIAFFRLFDRLECKRLLKKVWFQRIDLNTSSFHFERWKTEAFQLSLLSKKWPVKVDIAPLPIHCTTNLAHVSNQ